MSGITVDELIACERRVWEAFITGDKQADVDALADNFVGVYSIGIADKQAHASQLDHGPSVVSYEIHEPCVLDVAADTAMLIYRATYVRIGEDGQPADEAEMYVSSLWQQQDGVWHNLFSQDTSTS